MENTVQAQPIREALTSLRGPYQSWMMAVLDERIAAGEPHIAAHFGKRATPYLLVVDGFLEELEDAETASAEQAYAAGVLVGWLAYAAAADPVDTQGTIKARAIKYPEEDPKASAMIRMRKALEAIQI